ncbi:glycoside hydrolase family protein [Brucellaceae bacterium C25G]
MTRRINAAGLSVIQQWEGLKLTAYKDVAGIWTISYGHTSAAG